MPTWIQYISFALAVIGSFAGIYALILNHQRTTIVKQNEKERLESMKKAIIRVERTKEKTGKVPDDLLILRNTGQAVAKNISVRASNNVNVNDVFNPFPKQIYSGDSKAVEFFIYGDTPIPFDLIITWDDDFQKNNTYELTIY
jgi:hypothetical protein